MCMVVGCSVLSPRLSFFSFFSHKFFLSFFPAHLVVVCCFLSAPFPRVAIEIVLQCDHVHLAGVHVRSLSGCVPLRYWCFFFAFFLFSFFFGGCSLAVVFNLFSSYIPNTRIHECRQNAFVYSFFLFCVFLHFFCSHSPNAKLDNNDNTGNTNIPGAGANIDTNCAKCSSSFKGLAMDAPRIACRSFTPLWPTDSQKLNLDFIGRGCY